MKAIMKTPFIRVKCAIENRESNINLPKVFRGEEVPYYEMLEEMAIKYGYEKRYEHDEQSVWVNPKLEKKNRAMQKYFDKMCKKMEKMG